MRNPIRTRGALFRLWALHLRRAPPRAHLLGLTDRRAIIISGLSQRTTQSLSSNAQRRLSGRALRHERHDHARASGCISFVGARDGVAGDEVSGPPSFELISNARSVFAQIREAQSRAS